jgi:hypothetical protein
MILFLVSILAGVVASLLTVFILQALEKNRESRFFRKFLGQYEVSQIDGTKIEGEIVELSYIGPKHIKATSKVNNTLLWESNIAISTSHPHHGEGVYSYLRNHDFGIHSMLISPDRQQISVHFRNLSHRDGRYGGVLWTKKDIISSPHQGVQRDAGSADA